MSLRLILSVLMGVAVVVSTGGRAEAQLSPDQKAAMRQHYDKATRAYDVEKYPEAVDEYQKAYEIGGDPAMLYNIAQAYRLNDQLPDALHFYRRYLQRSPNARNRDDVERKIADLELTIEARRKAAEIAAAAAAAKKVEARPVVAPPPAPYFPPPKVITLPPPKSTGNPQRVVGIVLVSAGAAGLITAGITGYLAGKKADDLTSASKNGGTFNPSVESSGKSLNTVAIVSVIGGGVLAAVGTVLLVLSHKGTEGEAPAATVAPVVGVGTVGASAVFTF